VVQKHFRSAGYYPATARTPKKVIDEHPLTIFDFRSFLYMPVTRENTGSEVTGTYGSKGEEITNHK